MNQREIEFNNITKPLEEISKELDQLMKSIDRNKNYLFQSEDYALIIIRPLDYYIEESTVHIDFSECEKELRAYYNIPDSEQLSVIQMNIVNQNDNRLNDQVEYKIYNAQGDPLDLSICKDVNIPITYDIKNSSLLNLSMISNFKNMGVDIFNINDDFFNDICYPYSDSSNNDIVLTDRVSDIYQNLSLCDNGCEYDYFNMEKMQVVCNCEVKTEINVKEEDGNFVTSITSAFFNSNFGVIKCYNLVFSLKGKLKNIGFWIFLVVILLHIPIYIFYFKKSVDPIRKYIKEEMKKKKYIINKNTNGETFKKEIKFNNDVNNDGNGISFESNNFQGNKGNLEIADSSKLKDYLWLNSVEPLKNSRHNNNNPPLKIKNNESSDSNSSNSKNEKKGKNKKSKKEKEENKFKLTKINEESNTSSIDNNDFDLSSSNDKKKEITERPKLNMKSTNKINHMKMQNYIQENNEKNEKISSPHRSNEKKVIIKIKRNKSDKVNNKTIFNSKDILNTIGSNKNINNKKQPKINKKLKSKIQSAKNNKKLSKIKSNSLKNTKLENNTINFIRERNIPLRRSSLECRMKPRNKKDNNKKITITQKKMKKIDQFNLIRINADNTGNHNPLKSNYILDNYTFRETKKYEKRKF